jgi:hypothetical protein
MKRYRIIMVAIALLFPMATVLAPGTSEALSQNEYCASISGKWACLNAWGGGPHVNVYTGGPNHTANNYFIVEPNGTSVNILSTQGGGCIGDASNIKDDAQAGLVSCGTGWGSNFTESAHQCPNGTVGFFNNHWGGWLGPIGGFVNGSPFYLNKPATTPICFEIFN